MSFVVGCVDDDVVYARALRKEFSRHGVELEHFDRPAPLVGVLEDDPLRFDMILIDLNMADTKGVVWTHAGMQVAQVVRRLVDRGATTICMLSSMDRSFVDATYRDNGADEYIQKGRRLDLLAEKVVAMIRSDHAKEQARTAYMARRTGFLPPV